MFKLRKTVSFFARIKESSETVSNTFKKRFEKVEAKVAGTFVEKWLKFWINLARDYRDVAVDLVKETREKPSQAILIGTSGWLLATFAVNNPSALHFRDTFVQAANDSIIVNHTLVKPDVLEHMKSIEHAYNNGLVRHTSFLLFSIIWIDKDSKQCSTYETQCDYLKLGYKDVYDRIIDVGFLDTWWGLVKKMKDYDINY